MHQATLPEKQTLERLELVKLIRQWGSVNTDGLLDDVCQIYTHPTLEGFIGYRLEGGNAVVFGDPVCSPKDRPAFASAFQEECAAKQAGVVYTMASKEFADWAYENLEAVTIEFGENFVSDPSINPLNNKGSKGGLVRKKVKHALNNGVVIKEYLEEDPQIELQMQNVAAAWLKKRRGPQIYLSHLSLFKDRQGKRWFYALQGAKVTGLLVLNKLESRNGWLLNNLMISKEASPGVSELMIVYTFQALEKEGCHFVLVGPLPGRELKEIRGANGVFATITRWLYTASKKIFSLDGQATFWQKFQPSMEGSYLVFPKGNLNISSTRSILKAFNASGKV